MLCSEDGDDDSHESLWNKSTLFYLPLHLQNWLNSAGRKPSVKVTCPLCQLMTTYNHLCCHRASTLGPRVSQPSCRVPPYLSPNHSPSACPIILKLPYTFDDALTTASLGSHSFCAAGTFFSAFRNRPWTLSHQPHRHRLTTAPQIKSSFKVPGYLRMDQFLSFLQNIVDKVTDHRKC